MGELTLDQQRAIAIAKAKQAQANARGTNPDGTVGQPPEGFALDPQTGAMVDTNRDSVGALNQGMSGINEGLATILGLPGDMSTGVANMAISGANALGADIPKFAPSPLGGDAIAAGMTNLGMIGTALPDSAMEQAARRVGSEIGAYAIPGGAVLGKSARVGKDALALLASALTGGGSAAVANQLMPGSPTADIVASLLGGYGPVAVMRAMRPTPRAPSESELAAAVDTAYGNVRVDKGTINDQSLEELVAGLRARTRDMGINPNLTPRADATLRSIEDAYGPLPSDAGFVRSPRTIADIEDERKLVGNSIAGQIDPNEVRIGGAMRDEIDEYLANLQPSDVTGGNPSMTIEELQRARELAARQYRANQVQDRVDSGVLAANTSGTGGNQVNTIRQKIKWIIDPLYPARARGYSEADLKLMREIAEGGTADNLLRLVGRTSPTSGFLPAMGTIGLGLTGNPLPMAIPMAGLGAKTAAEAMTKAKTARLVEQLRNGGPVPMKQFTDSEMRIIEALIGAGAASANAPSAQP